MTNQKQKNKIFLLLMESGSEYAVYLAKKPTLEAHDLIVCCLSVSAIQFCEEKRISYILPEHCYTEDECFHYRGLSEKKIKNLVKKLNGYYHEKISSRDGFFFDMGNYHYFMLYHFFGALHYRSFILWKVIDKLRADKILIGLSLTNVKSKRPFPVSQYPNNYFDLCMNSVYKDKVIPLNIEAIAVTSFKTWKTITRNFLSKKLRKIPFLNEYLNLIQNNIHLNLFDKIFFRSPSLILLVGSSYSWKYVISDPRLKNKVNMIYETDDIIIHNKMIKDWFGEWFNWTDQFCGFDVAVLGKYEMARVKLLCDKIIANHRKTINRVKKYKAFIYSVCPFSSQQYLLSIGKHLGIPRICYQHGEMSLYYPGLWNEASELLYLSHYFSFGEQVSIEKTKSSCNVPGFSAAVTIGSASIDRLRKIEKIHETYILYASSKYINYAGGFLPSLCDVHVMKNQSLLIEYFEELIKKKPDLSVIWKLNPERLTAQPIKKNINVRSIMDEKSFTELLPGAQIVILDRPSTTSLEVCMTDKPLFVLLALKNWYTLPEELLQKRAVIAYTPENLLQAVDKYLTTGHYPADVKNREFIRAYGTHFDDGESARRAADELIKISKII